MRNECFLITIIARWRVEIFNSSFNRKVACLPVVEQSWWLSSLWCLSRSGTYNHDPRSLVVQLSLVVTLQPCGFFLPKQPSWQLGVGLCKKPTLPTSQGGGGGTQVHRRAAPSLRISRKKGSFFKTSACPRFCKRRVLFCTQIRSMGVKIPLQSTKYTWLWRRVTPEVTGLPSLLPPLAAAKQAEDYNILSWNTCSRSSNVSVLIKEGVFI